MSEQEALAVVSEASESATSLMQSVQALVIAIDPEYAAAGETLTGIAARVKALEEKRVEIKAPILDAGRKIDALFKGPMDILTRARGYIETARRAWYAKKQAEAEAAAALARQAAEREQARLDKLAQQRAERALKKGDEERAAEILATAPQVPIPVAAPPVVPKTPGVSDSVRWKHRVVTPDLVPREWLIPDEKGLADYAKGRKDQAKVPGVEFFPVPVSTVRGAKW